MIEPRKPPSPAEGQSAEFAPVAHRVLLVDDSADDAELSLLALRRSGLAVEVEWVRDGAEAMRRLDAGGARGVRLMLLDLRMPHMDGYEVLQRVKGNSATRGIPVVVMVSAPAAPEIDACIALGADAYLVKPLDGAALRQLLTELNLSSR